MNKYERLITEWTEAVYNELEACKDRAKKATRADYHKGMADGLVSGLSYAMATLAQMERRMTSDVTQETVRFGAQDQARVGHLKQPSVDAKDEQPMPVIKRVVAFKCGHCGDEGVVFTDPTKPVICNKCQHVHHFAELHRASYFCECGKICKFMMESTVEQVKCHCCKKSHRMAFSRINNEFYSLDNRDRGSYPSKTQSPINKTSGQTKFKRPQEKYPFHVGTCLECNEEFMTTIENCVTCDKCAGKDK